MLGKHSKFNGDFAMRNNLPDGKDVKLPARFSSVHPSPLADATGYPYILSASPRDYKKEHTVTSNYVNFGDFGTLCSFRGSLDFTQQEAEPGTVAPVPVTIVREIDEAQEEPAMVHFEQVAKTDADGDIIMEDYVEPEPEALVAQYQEPEPNQTEVVLYSSPFQEVPDEDVKKYFDRLASEDEEGLFDGDEFENRLSEEDNSSPRFSSADEVSPIEEDFTLEITQTVIRDSNCDDQAVQSNGVVLQDAKPIPIPEVEAERAADLHQVVWESKKSAEENANADLVKNLGHKRGSSDPILGALTKSTEDNWSGLSPPTSDDEHEEDQFDEENSLLQAIPTPPPVAPLDEDLSREVVQVKENVIETFNPGYIAVSTCWMVMDPWSFFTIAGVGILAWAGHKALRML